MFCSNLIPHTDFYKGYWFKSENCSWYHFYLTTRKFSNNTSEKFYKSVDKNLVDLIKLLHSKNIITTPSCAGHDYSEEQYRILYKDIIEDYKKINSSGLKLTNIETEESTLYLNKKYHFPYLEDDFVRVMKEYGSTGVVGAVGNFTYIKDVHGLTVDFDGYVTNFVVTERNREIWEYLYNEFLSISKH